MLHHVTPEQSSLMQVEYAGQGAALMASLEGMGSRAARINMEEHLFDLPKSEWPRVAQLQKELQPYLDLWVRCALCCPASVECQCMSICDVQHRMCLM